MPFKVIKRPYKAILGHTRTHEAMLILIRPHIIMAVKNNNKTIRCHIMLPKGQGHIRAYKDK